MLVAHDSPGSRVEASRHTPPAEYFCPTCGSPVVAKPGRIKVPHFAHTVKSNCPSAGESPSHLHAKRVLAEQFRAVGYEVTLEEHHSRERRVDVAVTLPHPARPLRYAVEVQNSAIDPREMFRRFIADLESSFWWTAWVFTGARAAPLLAAVEGTEVRLPADVLAAHGAVMFPEGAKSRQRLTDLVGLDPSNWMGMRLSASYGCISSLKSIKCLDPEGALWSVHLDDIGRYDRRTGRSGRPLQWTKRVGKKRKIACDLFGPVWGTGDAQRLAIAAALAESLPRDNREALIDFDEIGLLAARALDTPRTKALDEWVQKTMDSIMGWPLRPHVTASMLRRAASIFVKSNNHPLDAPPCGWPTAPNA